MADQVEELEKWDDLLFIEVRLLRKILTGQEIEKDELEELETEISPEEFDQLLTEHFSQEKALLENTLLKLINWDPIFLSNLFVQAQINVWRHESHSDETAKRKLKRIGEALIPSSAKGHKSPTREYYPDAYESLKSKIEAFTEIAEEMARHIGKRPEEAAESLIDLCRKRKNRTTTDFHRLTHLLEQYRLSSADL
jgi:hypothetical protein